jgi:hypothetical protein
MTKEEAADEFAAKYGEEYREMYIRNYEKFEELKSKLASFKINGQEVPHIEVKNVISKLDFLTANGF